MKNIFVLLGDVQQSYVHLTSDYKGKFIYIVTGHQKSKIESLPYDFYYCFRYYGFGWDFDRHRCCKVFFEQ